MRRSPIRSLKLLSLSLSLSLAAALLLQTCVCQAEQANSQDDIYNALFLKMSADCPVYVGNLTSSKTALVQYDGGAFANLFSTSSSVGISYNSANRTPQKLQWQPVRANVHVIDAPIDDQERAALLINAGKQSGCVSFLYYVSAPGISEDGGDAVVLVSVRGRSPLYGIGRVYRLRRHDAGAWEVVDDRFLWSNF